MKIQTDLEPEMREIIQRMLNNKVVDMQCEIKLTTGEKYKFHVKRLKK